MKWHILLMIILISCAPAVQEVTTKPKVEEKPAVKAEAPVLEPEVKPPQQVTIKPQEPETPAEPAPAEPPKPQLSPEEECLQLCEGSCQATAQNACTQTQRSVCKDMCNDNPTIDPSACTQACTYITQPNVCKQQMEQFCSAQCVRFCK